LFAHSPWPFWISKGTLVGAACRLTDERAEQEREKRNWNC
jgi:hypothetical protein